MAQQRFDHRDHPRWTDLVGREAERGDLGRGREVETSLDRHWAGGRSCHPDASVEGLTAGIERTRRQGELSRDLGTFGEVVFEG